VRALLSVWNKRGLEAFARGLCELGWDLVASGGTAAYLEELEIAVIPVERLTDVPELLGGREKTLHPHVHAGILARRNRSTDLESLDEHAIEPFDLVCVNLYPFAEAAAAGADDDELVELIDVGGPALIRAAAKNHAHVAAVTSPGSYADVLEELREHGRLSAATRRRLAGAAFATTAAYEAAIAEWFAGGDRFPEQLTASYVKERDLVYGENPHQSAAFYAERGAEGHLLTGVEQLHGRELSATNLLDLALARRLAAELERPACVIVKHANPCGVAIGATIEEAFERALACDPVSAFGMACALNRPVGGALGARLAGRFVDLVFAPAFDGPALAKLRTKQSTRVLAGQTELPRNGLDFRRLPGGLLVQERDAVGEHRRSMRVACGDPSWTEWRDLLFAWRVCRHATSNAIVIARDGATLGIGAGQVSRVDAVRIAIEKARAHGHDPAGAVLASDGFFPFADGPELAFEAGVTAVIQPGGSKRDREVVAAARAAEAAMVLTGVRHFRH
jgi:phosphoribosylaminoimidazolecarboxamide formyltransferase/IMP cyclohydrolase